MLHVGEPVGSVTDGSTSSSRLIAKRKRTMPGRGCPQKNGLALVPPVVVRWRSRHSGCSVWLRLMCSTFAVNEGDDNTTVTGGLHWAGGFRGQPEGSRRSRLRRSRGPNVQQASASPPPLDDNAAEEWLTVGNAAVVRVHVVGDNVSSGRSSVTMNGPVPIGCEVLIGATSLAASPTGNQPNCAC